MRTNRIQWLFPALLAAALFATAGCADDPQKVKDEIDAGEVALGGNRFDVAIEQANQALHPAPNAQAYYLRGRAEEDRPKPDSLITAADLEKARADYQCALDLHPRKPLAARCRAGLANIAFAQGDYAAAIYQWTTALDDLEQPEWRASSLYQIGQAQQRLGRFDDADKTFAKVAADYGDQDVATQALARKGQRGFYVQIGSFTDVSAAQSAITAAHSAGVECHQASDQGLTAVRAGPYVTYAEAQKAKDLVTPQFPAALVGP